MLYTIMDSQSSNNELRNMNQKQIEQKFEQFKKSISQAEFDDLGFLAAKADELSSTEPLLAQRIQLRITRVKQEKLNKRFNAFKTSHTQAQLSNTAFLSAKAEQLESSDPELSKRIYERVENLKILEARSNQTHPITSRVDAPDTTIAEEKTSDQKPDSEALENNKRLTQKLKVWLKTPFSLFVLVPTLVFAFYQTIWASERYESQAKVIVQQPDATATMDASMAILSGLGVSTKGGSDTELVKAYIYSNDMLLYLEDALSLRAHFSSSDIDYFSRIHDSDTKEDVIEYYRKRVKAEIEDKSGVISVHAQGFTPEFAQKLANTIVDRSEWYINSIGHQLAEAQLKFIQGEHALVEDKLQQAQTKLLNFQQKYNLLDPTAEGMAVQQIAYELEGKITQKEAELKGLRSIMSVKAPRVVALNNELSALRAQLDSERSKLVQNGDEKTSVSEILAQFTDLKITTELALKAYTSSQVSLEKSRIEAYRKLKYLIVVEAATVPEDSKYPDTFYNITLFAILASMLFAIGKIIISTIHELK